MQASIHAAVRDPRGHRVALLLLGLSGCTLFGDGEGARFKIRTRASAAASESSSSTDPMPLPDASTPQEPRLCVFDHDLTLSSHNCADTADNAAYHCRENQCDTYGWYPQCLAKDARAAVAECVQRHAYVGIASKADVDYCWSDKVLPIVAEQQFPELTGASLTEFDSGVPIDYPAIDDRSNWNCDDCAYTMDGSLSKPEGIRRVMRHFGLDPTLASDRARVIFWDDTPENINDVRVQLPEVRAVLVPRFTNSGVDGGCGITRREIDAGWAE